MIGDTRVSWMQWFGSPPRGTAAGRGRTAAAPARPSSVATMTVLVAGNRDDLVVRVKECLANDLPATARVLAMPLRQLVDRAVAELPQRIVLLLEPEDARGLATLRELKDLGFGNIVAVGPGDQAHLILNSIQQGAFQFVGTDQIASELPRLVKQGDGASDQSRASAGKVISVLGTQGGCGASTCATNLALTLAQKYQSVALIDLDLRRGDVAALLDLETRHSVADLCRNVARMDRAMFDQCFTRHESGVAALAAPRPFERGGQVTPVGVRKLLNMARMAFPFTLVDLPHTASESERQTLLHSDEVLVVTILDFTALRHARRVLAYLQGIGISDEAIRLVVNRKNRPQEMSLSEARRILQREFSFWIPEDAKHVNHANNHGTPVVAMAPKARVSKAIREMAFALNGRETRD